MAAKKTKKTNYMNQIEDWFDKLPSLPKGGKDALVQITPWIALIFGILGILAGLAGLGVLTVFSPFAMMGGYYGVGSSFFIALLGLVASVLLLAAFPGTKARKMNGWMLFFWSEVVTLVSSVIAISISGVIVALIVFYLLYQIKSSYK